MDLYSYNTYNLKYLFLIDKSVINTLIYTPNWVGNDPRFDQSVVIKYRETTVTDTTVIFGET